MPLPENKVAKENKVYFIDDSGYKDAVLLKVDLDNFVDTNTTTSIHVLEGDCCNSIDLRNTITNCMVL